jgi:hypothetical protein
MERTTRYKMERGQDIKWRGEKEIKGREEKK